MVNFRKIVTKQAKGANKAFYTCFQYFVAGAGVILRASWSCTREGGARGYFSPRASRSSHAHPFNSRSMITPAWAKLEALVCPSLRCYDASFNLAVFRVSCSFCSMFSSSKVSWRLNNLYRVRSRCYASNIEFCNSSSSNSSIDQSKYQIHGLNYLIDHEMRQVAFFHARSPRIRRPNWMAAASGMLTFWLSPWFGDWKRRISVRAFVSSL